MFPQLLDAWLRWQEDLHLASVKGQDTEEARKFRAEIERRRARKEG